MLGLDASDWISLAVAAGTGALALSTWWMARSTRDQVDQTRRLADVASRQLAETGTARLTAANYPEGLLYSAEAGLFSSVVANIGGVPARILDASVMVGEAAFPGGVAEAASALVASGSHAHLEFPAAGSPELRDATLTVRYEGAGSGVESEFVALFTLAATDGFVFKREEYRSAH